MPSNGVNPIISWGRDVEGLCTSRRALGESTRLLNFPSYTNPQCNTQSASRLKGTTCADWLHLKALLILICGLPMSQQLSENSMSLRSLSSYTELETAMEGGSVNLSLSLLELSGFNLS